MANQEERGWTLLDGGDVEGARNTAVGILEAESDSVPGLCLMAAVQVEDGDMDKALVSLERARDVDPEDVRPHIQSAEIHIYSHRPEQALQCALLAIDTAGDEADFVDAVLLKAAAETDLGDTESARRSLSEIDPSTLDEPPLLLRAGDLWLGVDEWQSASTAFSLCLELEPELADAHYGLGCALAELGDDGVAAKHWLRAHELDSIAAQTPAGDVDAVLAALISALGAKIQHSVVERPSREDVEQGLDPRSPFDVEEDGAVIVFRANLPWATDLAGVDELAAEIAAESAVQH